MEVASPHTRKLLHGYRQQSQVRLLAMAAKTYLVLHHRLALPPSCTAGDALCWLFALVHRCTHSEVSPACCAAGPEPADAPAAVPRHLIHHAAH